MSVLVWTPRGFELVDAEDFERNWHRIDRGRWWESETYDRKEGEPCPR